MKQSPLLLLVLLTISSVPYVCSAQYPPDAIWDIAVGGVDTVFMEEMTAGEIAAAIRSGSTSVIVGTGGLEQNGPNVVTGKHNYTLRATTDAIARKYGNTLVSSIVQFVPEGRIDPPEGHMQMPGTISLTEATYEALLTDICRSLRQNGFRNIFLIGDSGGNQDGMRNVADALSAEWQDTSVHYLAEYYEEDAWSYNYMKELGFVQQPDEISAFRNKIHTDLHYEAIMALIDPDSIRGNTRLKNGNLSVHGVEFDSIEAMQDVGRKLVEYRADITVRAMRAATAN
jgi:creatinine amidohydrolase/Fe(II)-dependent formamide hydrolase-like protein